MELPDDVVFLVHRALHETVTGITTSDAEVQAQMDLQEEALDALTSLLPVPGDRPADVRTS
jgi:hypothetical protein